MSDRYDTLTPPLIIATLRSMPRRYAEALESVASMTADEVLAEVATDLSAALSGLEVIDRAIHTTADHAADPLPPAVDAAVAGAPTGLDSAGARAVDSATDAVAALDAVTTRLAERLDRLTADDWNRSAASPTASYDVTDLARGAARLAAERLRAIEGIVRTLGDDA